MGPVNCMQIMILLCICVSITKCADDKPSKMNKMEKLKTKETKGKLLSLFSIVQFRNLECQVVNQTGSCLTATQVTISP